MKIVWGGVGLPDTAAPVQENLGVVVEGNHIAATGDVSTLKQQYPEADLIGGDNLLLMPAFINSHDHGRALGSASLGAPDDILEIWLKYLGGTYQVPPELAAQYEGLQLLKAGVCSVAHSHNPAGWEALADEVPRSIRGYQAAGVRVAMHPPLVDQNTFVYFDADKLISELPPKMAAQAEQMNQPPPLSVEDYIALLERLYDTYHDSDNHTLHIQASPAGGQWCSDELVLACVDFAKRRGTKVQMHMLETQFQRAYAQHAWGKSFMQHLDEIGALGEWLTLAHMVWVDNDDLPLVAERGVGIAHNASSNVRLRSGIAPVREMLDAGVRVGIGMDGHTLDDDQDFLREMRLAWKLANMRESAPPPLEAQTFLTMGTVDGAAITFGKGTKLGKLEAGYLADMVLLDWDAVRGMWCPDGFPPADYVTEFMLQRAARQHVQHVMVNGEWKIQNGKHVTLDEVAIAGAIREALSRQAPAMDDIERLIPYLRKFHNQLI